MEIDRQAAEDFASFSAPPPEVQAAARKEREKKEKEEKKAAGRLKPEQLKAAEKLADDVKQGDQSLKKAKLLEKIKLKMNLIAERYPEKLQWITLPKNLGPKLSVEELEVCLANINIQLNKNGGLKTVTLLWTEGLDGLEKFNETLDLGYNLKGLGQIAKQQTLDRKTPNGEIVCGPIIPVLDEIAVEYSEIFSTSCLWRLMMSTAELVVAVHRLNSQMTAKNNPTNTEASQESEDLLNKL